MWLFRNIFFYVANFVVFQLSCINFLTGDVFWGSYKIFWYAAGVLLLLLLVKWRHKWVGILTLNRNLDKYNIVYTAPLSKKFMNWTYLFYGIETVVSLVFPFVYLFFDTHTWAFALLLFINGLEGLIFLVVNTRKGHFKLGINDNALVHNARGTYVLPFHELKSIVYKYDEYFFIYRSGETLTIPEYIVDPVHMPVFREMIAKKAAEHGAFITDKLRSDQEN